MFTAFALPVWGYIIVAIFTLIICLSITAFFLITHWEDLFISTLGGFSIGLLLSFFVLSIFNWTFPSYTEQTFSNPHNQTKLSLFVSLDKDEMNNTIAETIEADKVVIEPDSNMEVVRDMKNGEIFDFVAIDDGSKINGSFYFTEDSLEIIVENEQQVKKEYSINTKE